MEPMQTNPAPGVAPEQLPAQVPGDIFVGGHVVHPPPTLMKRVVALVSLLATLGLGAAIAVRVQMATAEQARMASERDAAAAAAGQAPEVDVVRPAPAQRTPLVVLTGALEPAQSADLGFEVPGRISRVEVSLGQAVRAGDPLASLDRASVGAQASASQAAIAVAQANVDMLTERVELLRTLVQSGAAPERDLTAATQQLAIAEAQVRQAQAGSRAVSTSVADHTLRAPFDGVVTRVPDGVGQVVGPGAPIFHVEDLSTLTLRTTVSQGELEVLRQGMSATLEGSSASGTVSSVVRSLDAQSRRAPAEVTVPNPDGRLVAHALVRARVAVGASVPALRIPATARRPDGTVLVVTGAGLVESRAVEAQADVDGSWLVSSGLSPEDTVVARAAAARPGLTIVPRSGAAPSAAAPAAAAPSAAAPAAAAP
jgi:RND family efflux transporter MFP subunit